MEKSLKIRMQRLLILINQALFASFYINLISFGYLVG